MKAAKKILSFLHEKYGEEFVLDGIGGGWGTMNNNTLKAMVGYSLGVDGEIEESQEEIEEYYEIWKEKRMKSFEQRK